jgi:drug/metabolite transporter (DMT)-like permease
MADLFIFRAFVELGPRETMVVMTLYPIISAIISWLFLDEQLSLIQAAGIGVTICGVMWVTYVETKPGAPGKKRGKRGLLFALLGAVTQSLAFILAKKGLSEAGISPVTGNMLRVFAGFIGVVAYTLVTGRFVQDFRNMRDRKALLLISGGALVGPVLGMILTLYALSLAPVGIVTTIMQISPIILLPVDRFLFKKVIPAGAVFGTLLAVGGAALLFLFP